MRHIGPIKVMVVDDSPLVRSTLLAALSNEPGISAVGGASNPREARQLIIVARPDVIILDAELPQNGGPALLKKLSAYYPVPVIMCCAPPPHGHIDAMRALELGATDVLPKPKARGGTELQRFAVQVADKVRAAAVAIKRPRPVPTVQTAAASFSRAGLDPNRYLVAIGASTGGTEAIKTIMERVPSDFPPVAIVQHMPEGFTRTFACRLDQYSRLTVTEAIDGEYLISGKALLARGGQQMGIDGVSRKWSIAYGGDGLVNRHCPSVDHLFYSIAERAGRSAIGVLLTGMGSDGAKGLLAMRKAGALTIGQDQRSCVVYGMPKVAADLGAVHHQAPPERIPELIVRELHARDIKGSQRAVFSSRP